MQALGAVGSRSVRWTRDDARLLLTSLASVLAHMERHFEWNVITTVAKPLAAAQQVAAAEGVGDLAGPIQDVIAGLGGFEDYSKTDAAKHRARFAALLQSEGAGIDSKAFDPTDTWGRDWAARSPAIDATLAPLVGSLGLVGSVVPTQAWRREAASLVRAPGAGDLLSAMLTGSIESRSLKEPTRHTYLDQVHVTAPPALGDQNAIIVRGTIWAAAVLAEPWVAEVLASVGVYFGTSGGSSNVARDERLGNAAAAALGSMDEPAAVAALGRMKAKVTNRNVSKQIAKALDTAAARAGLSASELLELAVPTLGLDAGGRREISLGDHVAILTIDADDVELTWRDPAGRITAKPPVAIADSEKAGIARAKEELKELRKSLAIERGRVEDLFVEAREWSVDEWRARYLVHPLTGTLGRRLIWRLDAGAAGTTGPTTATVIPDRDAFLTATGERIAAAPDARVRLWHPIDASEAEIAAWRTALLARQIRQPFKQAFREVYRVTDAELQTEVYSNRFAGHILRYPQARALMTARRWGSNFLGPFGGGDIGIAKRAFPSHRVRAEFWHGQLESEHGAKVPEHCTTDQVRFYPIPETFDRNATPPEPMPIRDVPAIVFGEAMRDVDLFVSVTSMGADRNWQDGGRDMNRVFDGYWSGYWMGELTATAEVRRDVLERMIPGLAIADRLSIKDRWLSVRGELRTYRIHLGSGNILMDPSDTYLCIVPDRGRAASEQIFLPFDDDPTLTIILSKAFLLVNDSKIKDETIKSQIRRR